MPVLIELTVEGAMPYIRAISLWGRSVCQASW